ncbi:YihY/virulence factor BrkB family protein [Sediminibacterium roseum]|uniref:YihY/virulence factor BrkB family protein n=1 Tax=Sediminibacterium roseum TaxID=1978412 RepID=A0ABW9ZTE4_9BACT|nr:YihY/virulence factor BrkB family protein [Sediminibacterium roseum]NCI49549.1 YihY/virulence factor BrkB family protein [Sediminibacterium roseum]
MTKKKKLTFKGIKEILGNTVKGLGEDRVIKLSGSLAYSTVFAMGPLMIVIISLCGIFLGAESAQGKVYEVLKGFVGQDTAAQLQEIIRNASLSGKSTWAAVIGGVALLIGATSVFAEIQDSINQIWGLKSKPKKGWVKFLKDRFLSFSVIVSLGFLLLVSLAITGIVEAISNRLQARFPDVTVALFYVVNLLLTLGISMLIFAVIFKVLPDANIRWKDVRAGALVTAVLFMLGKFAISLYVSQAKVGSTYGAAGSLVVLLVWIYYSSIILFLGAEFTKAWAVLYGEPIHPSQFAVTVRQVEVEEGKKTVQEKERSKQ